ncbi:hypothetical protein ACHMW7_28455 [Aminobacter sp. UC22_36]|uniref:hypothetical protein n=1 Tax=Aminobacter sp. UC22_36 TaxID=3374549 RepID=UPI0037579992
MDESQVVRLLISCGIAAVVGANGTSPYGGAHLWTAFALLAAVAAWLNKTPFDLLDIAAPIAFSYGAAAVTLSMNRNRER